MPTLLPEPRPKRECKHEPGSLFGECLRVWRGDMPQKLLAKKAGVSRESVSCWEQGTMHPTGDTVARVAEALGVDEETVQETIAASKQARKEARKRRGQQQAIGD